VRVHAHAGCGALIAIDATAARAIVVCKVASLDKQITSAHQSAAAVHERSPVQGYAARSSLHSNATVKEAREHAAGNHSSVLLLREAKHGAAQPGGTNAPTARGEPELRAWHICTGTSA
jgi:hypothetical protein